MKKLDSETSLQFANHSKKYFFAELSLILLGVFIYYLFLLLIDHKIFNNYMPLFIILFALIKVFYFLKQTFKRISNYDISSFKKMLTSFGFVIFIIIFSFAMDYTCLADCQIESFSGIDQSISFLSKLPNFLYFSIVTFATIGYGDITPLTLSSKFLVILEISFSFIMVVFILSNLKTLKH